jgi:fido (protein-threonine AMPylation protein)
MTNFDEYKRLGEPEKQEKAENWQTAIGLQQVDGLTPSEYLIETAKANIDGDITIDEVKARLDSYYNTSLVKATDTERLEEADKVSARIAEILAEKTFSFKPTEYFNIHKRLFDGIYKFAGKIRDYNITKDEWVLNGDTVYYATANNLRETLEYDFYREKQFKFKGLSKQDIVKHIAFFLSGLWQIHIFGEGNTRTTAVFLIKYLCTLGFQSVNNDLFAENSWYFRNSLVRANYENLNNGVHKTDKFLIRFLGNLLLGENNILKNREMLLDIPKINSDTVKTVNDTVNPKNDTVKSKNDTVNPKNDTVKTVNDTVNPKNDTVKSDNDTVKSKNDTVKSDNDTVKSKNDTVKSKNDTVKSKNDTVNTDNDTVNPKNDTVKSKNDTVKSDNDTVNDIDVVFILIKENPKITADEIKDKLDISISTAKRKIKALKDGGYIERIGSDKSGHWEVLKEQKL